MSPLVDSGAFRRQLLRLQRRLDREMAQEERLLTEGGGGSSHPSNSPNSSSVDSPRLRNRRKSLEDLNLEHTQFYAKSNSERLAAMQHSSKLVRKNVGKRQGRKRRASLDAEKLDDRIQMLVRASELVGGRNDGQAGAGAGGAPGGDSAGARNGRTGTVSTNGSSRAGQYTAVIDLSSPQGRHR